MNSDKLTAELGYDPFSPWPYHEDLLPTDRDWHRRRPAAEPRSPQRLQEVLCANPAMKQSISPLKQGHE